MLETIKDGKLIIILAAWFPKNAISNRVALSPLTSQLKLQVSNARFAEWI